MSAARFHLTIQDGRPVPCTAPVPGGRTHHMESAQHWWPPVISADVGWPLLSTAPNVTEEAVAALLVVHRQRATLSCPTGPKGAPHHRDLLHQEPTLKPALVVPAPHQPHNKLCAAKELLLVGARATTEVPPPIEYPLPNLPS
jgi:hypothetical protein